MQRILQWSTGVQHKGLNMCGYSLNSCAVRVITRNIIYMNELNLVELGHAIKNEIRKIVWEVLANKNRMGYKYFLCMFCRFCP